MKVKIKKLYDYDVSLCDGENPYRQEYWVEQDVTPRQLYDLIDAGEDIQIVQ